MVDKTLTLSYGNRNRTPIDAGSVSLLQRLRNLSNQSPTDSPYLDRRQSDIATGADKYAPSEAELIQQQLAPGVGIFRGESPDSTVAGLSRDQLRESGVQQFKRRLRALTEQYVLPESIKGQAELTKQGMANAGNIAIEQVKGENALKTAAVPRTVNTNVTTNAGGGGSLLYGSLLSKQAIDAAESLKNRANNWNTGLVGQVFQYPGSTQAHAFKTDLEFLKGNLISKALNEMRAASKTGGALGQVSDYEDRILSNIYGNIDQFNSPDKVRAGLQQVIDSLTRWEAAKQKYGAGATAEEAVNTPGISINTDPYGLFGAQ